MWEKIFIKILPKIWNESFQKIMKMDLTTQALRVCFKNKLIRSTWGAYVSNVIRFFDDCKKEAEDALDWNFNNPD